MGTGILYVSMQDHSALRMGIGKEKDAVIHLISVEDPINTPIRHSLKASNIPRCVPLNRPIPYARISRVEFRLTTSCPAFTSWAVHHYRAWYAGFLLNHPGDVRKLVADLLPYSVSYSLHEQGVFATIPPLSDAIWGTYSMSNAQVHAATFELPPLGFEDAVYVAVLAINAAGIWLLSYASTSRDDRGAAAPSLLLPSVCRGRSGVCDRLAGAVFDKHGPWGSAHCT